MTASVVPPPPPGFVIEPGAVQAATPAAPPPPPPGFVLEAPGAGVAPSPATPGTNANPGPIQGGSDATLDTLLDAEQGAQGHPGVIKPGSPEAASLTHRAETFVNDARGRDPRVDYKTGTDYSDAVALFQASGPREERRYLEQKYGKGNVFQDEGGSFYVQKDGKLVAPGVAGVMNVPAWLQAEAPALAFGAAGATKGAALGAPLGPLGAVGGAMVGGAIGTAAGVGTTEVYKMARDRYEKTPAEMARELSMAALGGAAGEGAGRAVTGAARAGTTAWRKFMSGGTKETENMTQGILRGGGVPPVGSVAPDAMVAKFHQAAGEKIGGSMIEPKNVAYVEGQLRQILQASGMPEAEVAAALREVLDPAAAPRSATAGAVPQAQARAHIAGLETEIKQYAANAQRQVDDQLRGLSALDRRSPPGDLGADVSGKIKEARADFARAASRLYERVDMTVGADPLVPTGPIRRAAAEIYDSLPKTAATPAGPPGRERMPTVRGGIWRETPGTPEKAGQPVIGDPRVLKVLGDLQKLDGKISFHDAQQIRSTLAGLADMTDLTPGVSKRQFDDLRQSINMAVASAGKDERAAEGAALLKVADRFYADGIKKFEDAMVNKLVAQARAGTPPDPGVIADQILKPGQTARATQIRTLVGGDVWKRVGAADFQNIVAEATDPVTRAVDPRKLANAIEGRKDLLDLTYGPRVAAEMRAWSQRVGALGGKIDPATLAPDTFGRTMRQMAAKQAELERFVKTNPVAAIAKDGVMPDEVVGMLVKPGQETKLAETLKFFGENSPQVQAIRQQALKELLASTITTSPTGAGRTVSGNSLDKALSQYTAAQQKMLFPNGLDDDLRLLAKEARFLFPAKQGDMAAGLYAGTVKAGMPATLPLYAYNQFWNYVLSRPAVISAMASGLREPGPVAKATKEAIKLLARTGGFEAGQGIAQQINNAGSGEQAPQAPAEQQRPQVPFR